MFYRKFTIKQTQNVMVISNVAFEPFFAPIIKNQFKKGDINLTLLSVPYGEYNSYDRYQFSISDIIIVWLNIESLTPDIWNEDYFQLNKNQKIMEIMEMCQRLLDDISDYSNAKILWLSFDNYFTQTPVVTGHTYNTLVDNINMKLCDLLYDKVCFIDFKHIVAEVGINNSYDPKGKYRWNSPYSKALIEAAVKEIYKQYLIEKGITKKCLILDCDNVLWDGIISEDGIENIKLGGSGFGRAYQDFQRVVLFLYYHGVILAVCSKNDLSDVMTMFREHSEMILKKEHIACFQVNWENKSDNIKRIAETLNIGLDSIVFVDDSPIEIEAVKAMVPEVTTILYERDAVYEQLSCFNLKRKVDIADIEKRSETYRTNQSRDELKSKYDSYDDYINALEIKMDIHESKPIEFSRITELTQRSNKCTNGKRYTVAEIKERIFSDSVKLYSLSVSDRFSDLGLVGALEIEGDTVTLFCLSCRALGRGIENKMLEFVANNHRIKNIEFKSTGKNEDVKTLLLKTFLNATL